MSTIKFDLQDDLEEIQARIYLDTHKKLTKKQLLELIFRIGKRNYADILDELQIQDQSISSDTIDRILGLVEDFGSNTEALSTRVDELCYGQKKRDRSWAFF